MFTMSNILTGAAGLAIVASAAPAAAQYAPNSGYNTGYNQSGGVVGAVINSVLGGGRYGAYGQGADRNAVDQCARAVEARVARDYPSNGYGQNGYGQNGYGNPNGYNRPMVRAQVVGITGVERRSNSLKVSGLINSGFGYRGNAYGNQGYANGYPNQGYANGYPNQGYPNQGYPNQGYPNQAYNPAYANSAQSADMSFSCRVDARGYVSNIRIDRMNRRG